MLRQQFIFQPRNSWTVRCANQKHVLPLAAMPFIIRIYATIPYPPSESTNTNPNVKQEKNASKTNIAKKRDESGGSIHVSNMKLDKLMNLVGETVINQARLKEFGQELRLVDRRMGDLYQQIVYDSDIVVRELQDR